MFVDQNERKNMTEKILFTFFTVEMCGAYLGYPYPDS